VHEQLAKAMRTERDRLEQDNQERARAERKKSQLLETQVRTAETVLLCGLVLPPVTLFFSELRAAFSDPLPYESTSLRSRDRACQRGGCRQVR